MPFTGLNLLSALNGFGLESGARGSGNFYLRKTKQTYNRVEMCKKQTVELLELRDLQSNGGLGNLRGIPPRPTPMMHFHARQALTRLANVLDRPDLP